METTFQLGITALATLIGAGVAVGILRGKLSELSVLLRESTASQSKKIDHIDRTVTGIATKVDELSQRQALTDQTVARHDERISNLTSGIRDIRSVSLRRTSRDTPG